eukprot:TRINITY_DN17486_c0_g1_i1.p1 TRINITY_DN17486_c0_g1~~TRINITY_DN17486_c0_g1_i1.p1  ORF type:complete len:118 (+),score=11.84 TRINITY_DN17486_c0_g1_i1:40-393(+)
MTVIVNEAFQSADFIFFDVGSPECRKAEAALKAVGIKFTKVAITPCKDMDILIERTGKGSGNDGLLQVQEAIVVYCKFKRLLRWIYGIVCVVVASLRANRMKPQRPTEEHPIFPARS